MPTGERCSYSLDLSRRKADYDLDIRDYSYRTFAPFDDLETDEDGNWHCPRIGTESDNRCIFHTDAEEVSDADIAQEITRILNDGPETSNYYDDLSQEELKRVSKQFIGVTADVLNLGNRRLDTSDLYPLDFRCARLNQLVLSGSTIGHDLRCEGGVLCSMRLEETNIDGDFLLQRSDINGDIYAVDLYVEGEMNGVNADIEGEVDAGSIAVGHGFDFSYCDIGADVNCSDAQLSRHFRLKNSNLTGDLNCEGIELTSESTKKDVSGYTLRGATIDGTVSLKDSYIDATCLFNELSVGVDLNLSGATIQGHLWLGGVDNDIAELEPAKVKGSANLNEVTVRGMCDCSESDNGRYCGSIIGGALHASNAHFENLVMAPVLEQPAINAVNLRGTTIRDGTLSQPEQGYLVYDLMNSTLGDVSIDPIGDNPTGHVRILKTSFEGFLFSDKRRLYSKIGWRIHQLDDEYREDMRKCYELAQAEELAKDFATLFAVRPQVAETVQEETPPFDTEWLAGLVFEDHHDIKHIRQHGPENFFPVEIADREAYRQGLVTFLAEYADSKEPNRAYAVLNDQQSASEIRKLAGEVFNLLDSVDDTLADERVVEQSIEVALAISSQFEQTSIESGDDSPYQPEAPNLSPTNSECEVTYLFARNGADEVGDNVASAEFFIKELIFRRKQHWQTATTTEEETDAFTRVKALYDWLSNVLLYYSSGYGERPRRVVMLSVGVVLAFSGIYTALAGGSTDLPQVSLLFSFQSFIAFLVGTPPVKSLIIRAISAVEGFLGAFLIALFVFTLTRSIDR